MFTHPRSLPYIHVMCMYTVYILYVYCMYTIYVYCMYTVCIYIYIYICGVCVLVARGEYLQVTRDRVDLLHDAYARVVQVGLQRNYPAYVYIHVYMYI
jgi:hypothetical protein